MSTNLYATLRRFSPWLSQTTRGWVWRPTRTPSGLPARRTASPCPALRRRVPTYLKEGSSASRGWLSQTATRTRLCSYKMYTCENNLSELFLIKPKCLFWQFIFFFLLDFSISTWWSCLKLKIQGPLRVLIEKKCSRLCKTILAVIWILFVVMTWDQFCPPTALRPLEILSQDRTLFFTVKP